MKTLRGFIYFQGPARHGLESAVLDLAGFGRIFFAPCVLALLMLCLSNVNPAWAHAGLRPDLSNEDWQRVQQVTRPATDFSRAEPFEAMQGGAGTTNKQINADIFSQPSANLSFEGRQSFMVGNGLFRKDWVSAPSSTQASDGLGPLFNARSCQACHVKDGRGTVPGLDPDDQRDAMALLIRLALPDGSPDPVYGRQFQPFAVPGLAGEGRLKIEYSSQDVTLSGGEVVTLMKPSWQLVDAGYGPLNSDLRLSARLASPMVGLGLLEAIHPDDLRANVDSENARRDGIEGRLNWLKDPVSGAMVPGRFGWKAEQIDILHQSSEAFAMDMGLSTPLHPDPYGDCTVAQTACHALPHGAQAALGAHEVPGPLIDFVALYAANLALPQRRGVNDPQVLAGKRLFYESNCIACHVPKYVTRRDAVRAEHRFQLIWPYTDLLLHDMGPGLADGQGETRSQREWRTAPLWGIGLTKVVNPQATWLHDGRARTLLEAVLWHGGDAQTARDRVVSMSAEDRQNLLLFLESL